MNFAEIKKLVIAEYDQRDLKSDVRYKALDDFEDFLKKKEMLELWNDVSKFPRDKNQMKLVYRRYLDKETLSGAESSMINEVYAQIDGREI
ncbi:MAG: hypothetical protein K2J48_09770 [Muribaculaceae bacterium]|nr:hypothetical protein [Muribaculaceae bacterium]MDE6793355.1 hypothetical protein [Muribaculaceae bacterium]